MGNKKKNYIICFMTAIFFMAGLVLSVVIPDKEDSLGERRKLAKMPEITWDNIKSKRFMNDFEKYTQDQFPLRTNFRKIKTSALNNMYFLDDKESLYKYDDYLVYMDYPLNLKSVKKATDRFTFIKEKYLDDSNKIYASVIPDKNIYLGDKSGHLVYNFSKMEEEVKNNMAYASYISIYDELDGSSFYKTDTHLKQEELADALTLIAEKMNAYIDTDYSKVNVRDDFYGVYKGQYAGRTKPDTLCYLTNDTIENMSVYDGENNKDIPVYNVDKADGRDPYEMFLSGPLSLVTITNDKADNDRRLIIFRDSFGSAAAPVLATAYKETVLIDIRYISPLYLDKFVSFKDADVLFLYSSLVLNSDGIK